MLAHLLDALHHRTLMSRVLIAVSCSFVLGAGTADAHSTLPAIASLRVSPRVLPARGGQIAITARVRHAISCTIYTYGFGRPRTLHCASGRLSVRRMVPANSGIQAERWTIQIEAHRDRQNAFEQSTIEVLPRTPSAPPVVASPTPVAPPIVNIDRCVPGPECDYGASYEHFENWGNTAPDDFGDCTFAAAANWLQILFHWRVDTTILGYEFAQAGGTARAGLPQSALWHYWEHDGIGGSYLTGLHSYYTTPENVRNGVRDYAAMVVQLSLGEGWAFAQYKAIAGLHDAVVMGFTPEGPLVATWGEAVQMTWEQWADEAVGMWGIGATDPAR